MAVLATYCCWMMDWQQGGVGGVVSMALEHKRIKPGQEDPKK